MYWPSRKLLPKERTVPDSAVSTAYRAAMQVIATSEPRVAELHRRRAGQPASSVEADCVRELRVAGCPSGDGELAL